MLVGQQNMYMNFETNVAIVELKKMEGGSEGRGLEQGKGRVNLTETEKSRREKKKKRESSSNSVNTRHIPFLSQGKRLARPHGSLSSPASFCCSLKDEEGSETRDHRRRAGGGGVGCGERGGGLEGQREDLLWIVICHVHPSIHPRAVIAECCS